MRLLALILVAVTLNVQAASISFLKGRTYKDFNNTSYAKDVITVDHFGQWEYGNVFFFWDISQGIDANDRSDFYGVIAPSLSLSKVTGRSYSFGPIKDVSLRVELEHVSGFTPVYFYGASFDLDVPRFRFVSLSTLLRDDPRKDGVGGQLNVAWNLPLPLTWRHKFSFQGFLSAGLIPEADDEFFMVTQPQILYDVANSWGGKEGQFEVGAEYSYSINRFLKGGTLDAATGKRFAGFNEEILQAMLKVSY